MGARKKALGAAAVSAVAMATLMGAQPASADVVIICDPTCPEIIGPPGGDVFGKDNAMLKVESAFLKLFNKFDGAFPAFDNVFHKFG